MLSRLFKECVEALGPNAVIYSGEESNKITNLFKHTFPITSWGKINWEKIDKKIHIGFAPDQIIPALEELSQGTLKNKSVYIEWSRAGIPVIKTDLDAIIAHFDDVSCISFEKFIFNPFVGYIIEIRPGDDITVGLIEIQEDNFTAWNNFRISTEKAQIDE